MVNRFLQATYLKIQLSSYLSSLEQLDELYKSGNQEEYRDKFEVVYAGLRQLLSYKLLAGNARYAGLYRHTLLFDASGELPENTGELHSLTREFRIILENIYNAVGLPLIPIGKVKSFVTVLGCIVLVILAVFFYSPLKAKYAQEKKQYNLLANEEEWKQRTIEDILALKEALQKYYADHQAYPKSSGGFDAVIAAFGESKEEWIPGLVPKYIKELPVDPRKSKDPRQQYMYRSDGKDFKLISHNPLGMDEIASKHPDLLDPTRPSWAFGAWSEGGKNW